MNGTNELLRAILKIDEEERARTQATEEKVSLPPRQSASSRSWTSWTSSCRKTKTPGSTPS